MSLLNDKQFQKLVTVVDLIGKITDIHTKQIETLNDKSQLFTTIQDTKSEIIKLEGIFLEEMDELESLVDNNPDDGSWKGR